MRHRFHSICPYYAMFPESFPETWIDRLTRAGEIVLDPFSGRGTTAFQAVLMNRKAIASDVNDVAYCLTKAKTSAPSLRTLLSRISQLESEFDGRKHYHAARTQPAFFQHAFSKRTLQQLLFIRNELKWRTNKQDAMIAALALGSLHGELNKARSYFSNQMPRTISTKPEYSVRFWVRRGLQPPDRHIFEILRERALYRYQTVPPKERAIVLHRDVRELSWLSDRLPSPIRCCITSPPYFDVTNFEEDQWLRLWFLGGPPHPTRGRVSRDDRHSSAEKYWQFIADMWRSLGSLLARKADIVIRMGTTRLPPEFLLSSLIASSQFSGRRVELIESRESGIDNSQTRTFRTVSKGCRVEIDCHFRFTD